MTGHLQVRSPWSQLGIFLGLLGAAFLFSSLGMVAVLLSKGISPQNMDLTNPRILPTVKWIQAVSSVTIFLLPAIVFARLVFTGKRAYFLGFRPAQREVMYLLAVLVIFFAFPFVFWLGELNQSIELPSWMKGLEKDATAQMEAFLKANSTMDVLVNVFIIALLPAVCEEVCFRGVLQRIMIQLFRNPWFGIITAAFIFSALHFQFQGFLPRMFLGILLGALYWFSGSLWPSIIAHFVNNAVQVVAVSYAPEYIKDSPALPWYAALASFVLVAGIVWFYQKISVSRYSKVYETDELNESNQWLA